MCDSLWLHAALHQIYCISASTLSQHYPFSVCCLQLLAFISKRHTLGLLRSSHFGCTGEYHWPSYSQHCAYHMYLQCVYASVAFVHIHTYVLTVHTARTCNAEIFYKLFCLPPSSVLLLALLYMYIMYMQYLHAFYTDCFVCLLRSSYPVILATL